MKNAFPSDLAEATRLTRAGRLGEATALLQRMLNGREAPGGENGPPAGGGLLIEGVAERIEPGEAEASPRAAMPRLGLGLGLGLGLDPSAADGKLPALPEALRGLLGRLPGGRVAPGIGPHAFRGPARAPELPEGARFLAGTFGNGAGSRPYKLYVPRSYRGEAVPLIVMLHGCTQSPDDFAAGTGMNAHAEEHGFLVAYPGQTQAANASKCWNWFSAGDQQRGSGEPSLIAGLTEQIMREYAVDRRRVYVAGLSAGGAAAAILGAAYPELYAAIGVHSGLACGAASDLPSAFAAMRQGGGTRTAPRGRRGGRAVPTIVFHGDLDTTVHPKNGDEVIAQSRPATPLEITVEEGRAPEGLAWRRTLHADATGTVVLEQWLVRGAAHAWSGGSPAGSYTDPRGPDASREMVRFFLEHAHPEDGSEI